MAISQCPRSCFTSFLTLLPHLKAHCGNAPVYPSPGGYLCVECLSCQAAGLMYRSVYTIRKKKFLRSIRYFPKGLEIKLESARWQVEGTTLTRLGLLPLWWLWRTLWHVLISFIFLMVYEELRPFQELRKAVNGSSFEQRMLCRCEPSVKYSCLQCLIAPATFLSVFSFLLGWHFCGWIPLGVKDLLWLSLFLIGVLPAAVT